MTAQVRPTRPATIATTAGALRVTLVAVVDHGLLLVQRGTTRWTCEWLETADSPSPLLPGDRLLALPPENDELGVVLGRIGPYAPPTPAATLQLQASESLTLACGEASLTLRADGKVLLKGEDVVVHAKGTQRIRAGTVAIN